MNNIKITKKPEDQDGLCYTNLYDDFISKGRTMEYLKQNDDNQTVAKIIETTGTDIFLHFTPTWEDDNWVFLALDAWDQEGVIEYVFIVHDGDFGNEKRFKPECYQNAKKTFIKRCMSKIEKLNNKEKYKKQINEFKKIKEE